MEVGRLIESTGTRFNWVLGARNRPVSAVFAGLSVTQSLALKFLLPGVFEGYRVDYLTGVGAADVHDELITG